MTWMLWLLAPPVAICLTAVLTWWVNRPRRPLRPARAVRDHQRFLTDLADVTETSAGTPAAQLPRNPRR